MHIILRLALIPLLLSTTPLLAQNCPQPPQLDARGSDWHGWGNGPTNTRHAVNGIDSGDLDTLQLRWTFGFADANSAVGHPVVYGSTLFVGAETGAVHALDADSGCSHWMFQAEQGVRTAPVLATIDARPLLFFGDRGTQVYALDARDGTLVWQTRVDTHPAAILTGSPQVVTLDGATPAVRLLVPVSSNEEGLAAVPSYPCCSFRGSMLSLDALTGTVLWQQHTIQSPVRKTGDDSRGPSGAAIWSPPTLDPLHQRLFVTTGDAYSAPADIATDAVMGLDLVDGRILWINQGTADDIWTVACLRPAAPDNCGPDQDYGSPSILVDTPDRQLLIAGQKSGWVRAFDPRGGSIHWRTALVENTEEFGGKIVWGGASDGDRVYFGLGSGGIHALRVSDGTPLWQRPLAPPTDRSAHVGHDGPVSVSADLLLSGGWDGVLRILSSSSGEELWSFDTVRDYDTVNAVPAHGGSMGAVGPIVAGKRVFVSSGYVGVKNGMAGNALLMFTP